MAKRINQLSALKVAAAKTKGLYADGAGLFLQVSSSGSKSWIYRYKLNGRARDMGLGSLTDVSLAKARRLAAEARERRQDGEDPIEARKATPRSGSGRRGTRPSMRPGTPISPRTRPAGATSSTGNSGPTLSLPMPRR